MQESRVGVGAGVGVGLAVGRGSGERRLYGMALVAGATLLWSSAGFFVRALDGLDVWTMVAWRSLFACSFLLLVAFALSGRALLRLRQSVGPGGLLAIPIMAVSMFSYVAALKLTSVANVMVVYATVPFVAAGLGFLLLRERLGLRALAACCLAFAGVLVMAGSATAATDLAGNAFALVMTLGFGASIVIARRWTGYNATLVTGLASGLCALACFLLASRQVPGAEQLVILFLFSLATQSLSYLFFLLGSRHIPASEAGLIALLDVVLGPLWVWLAFAERPSVPALIGGALTLVAVVGYLASWRPARATVTPPAPPESSGSAARCPPPAAARPREC